MLENGKVSAYGLSVAAEVETSDLIKHNPTTQSSLQLTERQGLSLNELINTILTE